MLLDQQGSSRGVAFVTLEEARAAFNSLSLNGSIIPGTTRTLQVHVYDWLRVFFHVGRAKSSP